MAIFKKHNFFPMKETFEQQTNKQNTILFEARLQQLGYECLSVSCEQFTTLKLVPKEIKQTEELTNPPSE